LQLAESQEATMPKDRWFEIETPDNRVLRVKHSSAENLKTDLLDGYTLRGEILAATKMARAASPARTAIDWSNISNRAAPFLSHHQRSQCNEHA
jgi:hypothetical protein